MTNQSFDDQVKQKATEHEAPVPAGVWEAIIKEKKKKRYPLFWWVTGSALLFVTIGFGIQYLVRSNRAAPAGTQTTVIQKGNTHSKEKDNTETSTTLVTGIAQVGSLDADNTANKNTPAISAAPQSHANNDAGAKIAHSSVTNVQDLKQTSSVSILPASGIDKSAQSKKPSLQQKDLSVSPGNSQYNTVHTGKKSMADKNNRVILSTDKESSFTIYPSSSFSSQDAKGDVVVITENPISVWSRNGYSLLSKQWNDLSVDHPAIADNMVKPVTPTIKRIQIKPSKWSLDISVIPFQPIQQKHSLLSLSRTTTDHMHTAEYKPADVSTTLKPALAYNLMVNKKINTRIIVGAGLQYTVIKEHITLNGKETNTSYEVVQRLDNSGPAPVLITDTVASVTTGTRIISAINSYRLLELPLLVQYTLIDRPSWSLRLNAGAQLGISTRYHNSINGKLVPEYSSGNHPQNKKEMGIGFFTGVRFTNRLNKKYQVFAAPYLRFSTGTYNANAVINSKSIHQAGMVLGISYKIGR